MEFESVSVLFGRCLGAFELGERVGSTVIPDDQVDEAARLINDWLAQAQPDERAAFWHGIEFARMVRIIGRITLYR